MPKLRRPTIPICDWRVAVHLEATKKIQGQHGTPGFNCDCDECTRWRKDWSIILPHSLGKELERFGIDPARPTDIYGGNFPRVSYHVVGKILSGPVGHYIDDKWGWTQGYIVIREEPQLMISVARSLETTAANPYLENNDDGELILIDLRLKLPEAA